jgi:hypothetical protein
MGKAYCLFYRAPTPWTDRKTFSRIGWLLLNRSAIGQSTEYTVGFPVHMKKAGRMIEDNLNTVGRRLRAARDARIPALTAQYRYRRADAQQAPAWS